MLGQIIHGDSLEWMLEQPDESVDLVFGSPPYEVARTYGELDFNLKGEDWVTWMYDIFTQALRISRGLVAFVVDGQTKSFRYSGVPHLLAADLIRAGYNCRRDVLYYRSGISGSGGPDWFRCDCEYVLCFSRPGRLPWSDNTACGHPPKYRVGGNMTNRSKDGKRANRAFKQPKLANPGNVIKCKVGGGHMGSKVAKKNEAPFPEELAERFVKSFCPPDGVVYDPFGGSGTTAAVAIKNGRNFITSDVRLSQISIIEERMAEIGFRDYERITFKE